MKKEKTINELVPEIKGITYSVDKDAAELFRSWTEGPVITCKNLETLRTIQRKAKALEMAAAEAWGRMLATAGRKKHAEKRIREAEK